MHEEVHGFFPDPLNSSSYGQHALDDRVSKKPTPQHVEGEYMPERLGARV